MFDGLQAENTTTGGDIGESETVPQEDLTEATAETETLVAEEAPAATQAEDLTEDAEKAPAE